MPVVISEREAHVPINEQQSINKMGSSVVKSQLSSQAEAPALAAAAATATTTGSSNEANNKQPAAQADAQPAALVTVKMAERCCNPFRIPRHVVANNLRIVPKSVRESLTHVIFGNKICISCRSSVYEKLKHRRRVSSSPRLINNNSQSNKRHFSEVNRQRRSITMTTYATPTTTTSPSTVVSSATNSSTAIAANNNEASTIVTPAVKANNRRSSSINNNKNSRPIPIRSVKVEAPPLPLILSNENTNDTVVTSETVLEQVVPSTNVSTSLDITSDTRRNSVSNLTDTVNLITISNTTMSRRSRSQSQQQQQMQSMMKQVVDASVVKWVCCFCGLSDDNELEFGKFYEHKGIVTHYYCLLLSSNMEQKGNDDEGILGFLADDIQKEIRRGKRLACSHCKKIGATLGCCNAKCKRIFHFPCGLKAGSLHQYFGEFRSYCINHRPKQKIDERVKKEVETMQNILCYICYEDVVPLDSNDTLWAPCCKKNAWFHRKCVQRLAMSAGYFFKCPLCNNKREFQTAMLEYGIFIPRQDASWELVPNAYEELLYRHDRCDAKACLCPKGRKYTSSNPKWELVLCRMCGSQGTHVFCGSLKSQNSIWDCHECLSIIKNPVRNGEILDNSNSTSSSNETNIRRQNPAFNATKEVEEDSDSDISVGKESLPAIGSISNISSSLSNIKLRPGPKSFKLQQLQRLKFEANNKSMDSNASSYSSNTGSAGTSVGKMKLSNDVIHLDSDDEAVEIVCESVMKNNVKNNQIELRNNLIRASSSNINVTNVMPTNIKVSPSKVNKEFPSTLTKLPSFIQPSIPESNDSPFNIIISNVTSVPPEFFASVPESNSEMTNEVNLDQPLSTLILAPKRTLPTDDGNDCEIVSEAPKRARIDKGTNLNQVQIANSAGGTIVARTASSLDATTQLSNIKQSPSKVAAMSTALGSNGASSSESCHEDAGTGPAMDDTERHYNHAYDGARASAEETILAISTASTVSVFPKYESASYKTSTTSGTNSTSNIIHTIFKNGPSSHHSSGSGSRRSSKLKKFNCYRPGLIPERVCLSDLKFKISGNDVELLIGESKIQMKINCTINSISNDISSDVSTTVSPFAGSNQSISSSKSSYVRSDYSEESCKNVKSIETQTSKNFVYEDDNTLLEYPISISDSQTNSKTGGKSLREKKLDVKELKENWDPEVSSSSIHTLDSANNNNQTNSIDCKESNENYNDKSIKDEDNDLKLLKKEKSNSKQRLPRRSNRITRYFQSVHKSNVNENSQISGDLTDSNLDNSSVEKSNQTVVSNEAIESSFSSNFLEKTEIEEQDKHLKNVDINDISFSYPDKINGTLDKNEIDANEDMKISIDLRKLENLLRAKPDLFFKTNNGVAGLRFYRGDEKLSIELELGNKKFLTKSQSFDCLLNIVKNSVPNFKRSKSLNDLSRLDSDNLTPLTDDKDCTTKNSRRSLRQRVKENKKHECVS